MSKLLLSKLKLWKLSRATEDNLGRVPKSERTTRSYRAHRHNLG
jgi:hypothetical protein